ncbi:AMP-binding protein [Ravibacter arvi]|uniref:AMP-binding protein n=1 Tax=Ravibacter arvi TaxID=2051041 RepID=A0ABP8LVF4_9BACT
MSYLSFNKASIRAVTPTDPYHRKAREICLSWLDGAAHFSLHTSGSTGLPKEIVVKRAQLQASVRASADALSLQPHSRVLACININYVGGFMMLIRAMELDWEVVLVPPVSNPLLDLPATLSFDFAALVPMQLAEIISNERTRDLPQKLGKILLGGVGLTPAQYDAFQKLGPEIYLGYGMTETVSHVALRSLSDAHDAPYRLTGDLEIGTDARGCLYLRGAVTDFELVQTNDLAMVSADRKSFRILGRIDNTVNSGGIKMQLETLDYQFGAVFREAGISNRFFFWKMPDPRLGEALVLVVEGENTLQKQIRALVEEHLERNKRPRKICFTELFLMTGSDKVDKSRTFDTLSGPAAADNISVS